MFYLYGIKSKMLLLEGKDPAVLWKNPSNQAILYEKELCDCVNEKLLWKNISP